MQEKFSLTQEEEKKLFEARKDSPYLRELDVDGVDYPIPELENTSRLILVDKDTVGSNHITFGYSKFEGKTALHKKHSHSDCEELMYIVSGRGVGGVGEHETIQQAGDTIFVPRGVTHWFYNPFDEPLEMLFLYTKPSLKEAGLNLESSGYINIGAEIERKQADNANE